jgi:hypothetical protein
MLFMMVTGVPPFLKANIYTDPNYIEFCDKNNLFWRRADIRKRNKTYFLSENFKNLVSFMLNKDPCVRPSIEEIKASPWYNEPVPS